MNILNELKSKFNIAEPIFDYEIEQMGYSVSDIEDTIKSGVFEELNGVDFIPCRIFYLVGYSEFTGSNIILYRNSLSLIEKYFIGDDFEFGYYSGLTLQNKLGLSTQVPSKLSIQSNRATDIIDNEYFYIIPNTSYKRSDFDYICLAEILNFNGDIEYDLSKTLKELNSKCKDKSKLEKYIKR